MPRQVIRETLVPAECLQLLSDRAHRRLQPQLDVRRFEHVCRCRLRRQAPLEPERLRNLDDQLVVGCAELTRRAVGHLQRGSVAVLHHRALVGLLSQRRHLVAQVLQVCSHAGRGERLVDAAPEHGAQIGREIAARSKRASVSVRGKGRAWALALAKFVAHLICASLCALTALSRSVMSGSRNASSL